jgi:hypothetical protein
MREKEAHVNPPSSLTSKNSTSSSLVSAENGAPFVSRAHASKPAGVKYAPSGGVNNATVRLSSDESSGFAGGKQYFAKMCLRQDSSCAECYYISLRTDELKNANLIGYRALVVE